MKATWMPLSIISLYLGRISSFELGFIPGVTTSLNKVNLKKINISYLCGIDEYKNVNNNSFIIYQGLFKTNSLLYNSANLIFPVSSFVERKATYLNLEGRLRFTKKIITAFKFVFTDFDIMRGLTFI